MNYNLAKITGLSKIEIIKSANQLADEIIDEGDILRAIIDVKRLTEYLTTLKEKLSDFAVEEAQKHTDNKNNVEFDYGKAILKIQSHPKYDYKSCGDKIHDRLVLELKQRKEFLKAIKEEMSFNDNDSGEVYEIMPPAVSGKDSITIKLL